MLPADDASLLARARIADADLPPPEEGLFRRDAWIRRVAAQPVLLLGGGRALLLEVAHPLVAAGVARHSSFRSDPFGRLQRTLEAVNAIVFGARDAALAAARGVERVHARVRGTLGAEAGPFAADTPYDGRDPELVQWVWATLVDSALVMTREFGEPLDAAAGEAFYRDQRVVARLLGARSEALPPDLAAFERDFAARVASEELVVTAEAREVADAVLSAPGVAGPARLVTAGTLPPRLREAFGLPWDEARAARLALLAQSVRALRRSKPGPVDARTPGR